MEGAAATVGGLFLFSLWQATSIKKAPPRGGARQGELNPRITGSFWRFAP
jgi:hypothetical protein